MGAVGSARGRLLTTYLLDSTVLIDWLRGREGVAPALVRLVAEGHTLGTSCVNLAELERGLRSRERGRAAVLTDRLQFLATDREASRRAGSYQADWARRGRTLHTPDALIAGTARVYGAVLVTDNVDDFPMRDIRVEQLRGTADG